MPTLDACNWERWEKGGGKREKGGGVSDSVCEYQAPSVPNQYATVLREHTLSVLAESPLVALIIITIIIFDGDNDYLAFGLLLLRHCRLALEWRLTCVR